MTLKMSSDPSLIHPNIFPEALLKLLERLHSKFEPTQEHSY